jgi:hypothetical protein
VRLLKRLCQIEEQKSVASHSDARRLEWHGIPREFTARSRVVIISNDRKTLNQNVAALQARGMCSTFNPARPRSTHMRGTGLRNGRFMSGLPQTCTGSMTPKVLIAFYS